MRQVLGAWDSIFSFTVSFAVRLPTILNFRVLLLRFFNIWYLFRVLRQFRYVVKKKLILAVLRAPTVPFCLIWCYYCFFNNSLSAFFSLLPNLVQLFSDLRCSPDQFGVALFQRLLGFSNCSFGDMLVYKFCNKFMLVTHIVHEEECLIDMIGIWICIWISTWIYDTSFLLASILVS